MRKKMKKYQPGGQQGMGTRNQPNPVEPVAPVMKTPPNSAPVNASQPQAPQAPVTPITSGATAQAPAMDPLLVANEKYTKLGYNPRKARRMAMKEVNPMNRQKVSGADVLSTINQGLDLANKTSGTIGAVRQALGRNKNGGETRSAFAKNGGTMSGKQLRKTSAFMQDGGSVNKSMNMEKKTKTANKARKKYEKAATAYSKGNDKKGDRKMAKGNKLFKKSQGVMKYGGTKRRKK